MHNPRSKGESRLFASIAVGSFLLFICVIYGIDFTSEKEVIHDDTYEYKGPQIYTKDQLWMKNRSPLQLTDAFRTALGEYIDRHKKARSSGKEALKHKYVVWDPVSDTGWGNRFSGIVSGLVVAMITDRLFFIEGSSLNDGVCLMMEHQLSEKMRKNLKKDAEWATEDIKKNWEEHRIVYVNNCIDYYAPLLQRNPHHSALIDLWFPNQELYGGMWRSFFQENDIVKKETERIRREELDDMEYVVGVQIRSKKFNSPVKWRDYCQVAKSLARSSTAPADKIKILLASDQTEKLRVVLQEIAEDFARCILPYKMYHTPVSQETTYLGLNPGSELSGVIDMMLLSNCSDMVITAGSSFGYIPSAITNLKPYMVTLGTRHTIDNPFYIFPVNSEPCYFGCRTLMRSEYREAVKTFKMDGMWQQYCQCHPDPFGGKRHLYSFIRWIKHDLLGQ
ncbi:hypothetical protein PROFUN_09020 [Planoprotostelium fungivorum]|uniref:Uncharacterized protein n=1 Tax=Planoprotostelium fungivorum TaxID=1890364 RepID=A0A2P6MV15_9EUKA|nr:hypothetical protein PROFUN_09020 [Planoprotostelium fungivorum]